MLMYLAVSLVVCVDDSKGIQTIVHFDEIKYRITKTANRFKALSSVSHLPRNSMKKKI